MNTNRKRALFSQRFGGKTDKDSDSVVAAGGHSVGSTAPGTLCPGISGA